MRKKYRIRVLRQGLIILTSLIIMTGILNGESGRLEGSAAEPLFLMADITHVSLPGSRGVEPCPWIVWRDTWTEIPYMWIMTLNAVTGQQMGGRLERELPYDHTPAALFWCHHFSISGKRGIEPSPWIVFRDYHLSTFPVTFAADGTPSAGSMVSFDLPIDPVAYGNATSLAELPGREFPDGKSRLFIGSEGGAIFVLSFSPTGGVTIDDIFRLIDARVDDLEPIPQLGYISMGVLQNNIIRGVKVSSKGKPDSPRQEYVLVYSLTDPSSDPAVDFDVFGAKDTALTNPEEEVRLVLCHGNTELGLAGVSAQEEGTGSLAPVFDVQDRSISSASAGSLLMLLADGSGLLFDPAYSPMTGSSGCAVDITDPVNDGCTIICGDANGDEAINLADAVFIINYVFKGGASPDPLCVADANGDGVVNLAEAVHLINYIFKGGPPPVEPCCP